MKLSDVMLSLEREGKRVCLDTPKLPFFKNSDGAWEIGGDITVEEECELFGVEESPKVVKSFIKDLINSSCEMPQRLRADLQALL